MRAVMFSIKPFWCRKIIQGEKTVEVRKRFSEMETPFKGYIYCTLSGSNELFRNELNGDVALWNREKWADKKGMVVGEFVCDKLESFTTDYRMNREQTERLSRQSRIPMSDLIEYEWNAPCLWGIHISDLVIYDAPKPLGMFFKECPGLENTGMCWECENAVGEECDCAVNGRLYLKRPPQSWCYVEELK